MLYQQGPGSYKVEFKVDATPNPDCNDPMCEQWLPGLYNIDLGKSSGYFNTLIEWIQLSHSIQSEDIKWLS